MSNPSEAKVRGAVARMSLMAFFPGDEDSRAAVTDLIGTICSTDDQVDKLSRKCLVVFKQWPGAHEIRACACSMFRPRDGMECASTIYPEGVPSFAELQNPILQSLPAAARRLDLPPAQQIEVYRQLQSQRMITAPFSVDPELEELVRTTAEELNSLSSISPRRTIEEIENELYKRRKMACHPAN